MKLSTKIIFIVLIGAVINGGFYTFQKIYYDKQILKSLLAQSAYELYFKNKNTPISDDLGELTLYVKREGGNIEFSPSIDITQDWVEKYFRDFTEQEETRLSWKNINAYLKSLESQVNIEPTDAKLEFSNNKAGAFSLSKDGYVLDVDKSGTQLFKQLVLGNGNIALITKILEPEITIDKINNLGITALLARGKSDFSGSPNSRIHNIKVSSAIYNGTLLKPGEVFSFNNLLGEVSGETGYLPELVIKGNKLIPEYGGGICQLSTTVFRAAINTGLPILERRYHSLPVRYYDPQGFDATIYPGVVDLKFKNDTPAYILIQTKIEGNDLIVEIYGSPDNRKVELSGPTQYDIKPDGSLKALLKRTVVMPDGEVKEDKFYSVYKSPLLFKKERNPLE